MNPNVPKSEAELRYEALMKQRNDYTVMIKDAYESGQRDCKAGKYAPPTFKTLGGRTRRRVSGKKSIKTGRKINKSRNGRR